MHSARIAHRQVHELPGAESHQRVSQRELDPVDELTLPTDDVVYRAAGDWSWRVDANPESTVAICTHGIRRKGRSIVREIFRRHDSRRAQLRHRRGHTPCDADRARNAGRSAGECLRWTAWHDW